MHGSILFADKLIRASVVGGVVRLTLGTVRDNDIVADDTRGISVDENGRAFNEVGQLLVPLVAFPGIIGELHSVLEQARTRISEARDNSRRPGGGVGSTEHGACSVAPG